MKKKTNMFNKTLSKIFGGLNITWPRLIIFSVLIGIYTALMAMLVPDGNSFHDIAVTFEAWVLFAVIIIVNSKDPLDSALKTFVFFLISQPLVYLVQVPFSEMGWGLFSYYRYWFLMTLLTFPAAYVGWFMKKDKWYSGVILSTMTCLLAITGVGYVRSAIETPLNHLLSAIFCFAMIPIFIFGIFKNKVPRLITAGITLVALVVALLSVTVAPYEVYDNSFIEKNGITLVGEPYVSFFTGEGKGNVELIESDGGYNFKITGLKGKKYSFGVTDDVKEYMFEYYYDDETQSVIVKGRE